MFFSKLNFFLKFLSSNIFRKECTKCFVVRIQLEHEYAWNRHPDSAVWAVVAVS